MASFHNSFSAQSITVSPTALLSFSVIRAPVFSIVVSGLPSAPHPYQKETAAHMFQQTRNLHICKTEDFHFFLPLLCSPSRMLLSNAKETKPQNAKEFKLHRTEREAFGAHCAECLAFVLCYFTHLQAAFFAAAQSNQQQFLADSRSAASTMPAACRQ